jgi:hypothetical protein
VTVTQIPLIPPAQANVGASAGGAGGSSAGGASSSDGPSADSLTSTAAPRRAAPRGQAAADAARSNNAASGGGGPSGGLAAGAPTPGIAAATIDDDLFLAGSARSADAARDRQLAQIGGRSMVASFDSAGWWNEIDSMNGALESAIESPWAFGAVVGVGALSAGYLAFGARAATLLAGALSSLPVWRSFDPLPILEFWEKNSQAKGRKRARRAKTEDGDDLADEYADESTIKEVLPV